MIMCQRLKAARKECKLTQQQIADILGVDRSTYAYYELGVSNPTFDNLVALAGIFKTDVDWLLGIDRNDGAWHSPENDLALMKAVKERHIGELSKDERRFLALYRTFEKDEDKQEIFEYLRKMAQSDEGIEK